MNRAPGAAGGGGSGGRRGRRQPDEAAQARLSVQGESGRRCLAEAGAPPLCALPVALHYGPGRTLWLVLRAAIRLGRRWDLRGGRTGAFARLISKGAAAGLGFTPDHKRAGSVLEDGPNDGPYPRLPDPASGSRIRTRGPADGPALATSGPALAMEVGLLCWRGAALRALSACHPPLPQGSMHRGLKPPGLAAPAWAGPVRPKPNRPRIYRFYRPRYIICRFYTCSLDCTAQAFVSARLAAPGSPALPVQGPAGRARPELPRVHEVSRDGGASPARAGAGPRW